MVFYWEHCLFPRGPTSDTKNHQNEFQRGRAQWELSPTTGVVQRWSLRHSSAQRHTLSHATSSQPTAIPTPDDTPVSTLAHICRIFLNNFGFNDNICFQVSFGFIVSSEMYRRTQTIILSFQNRSHISQIPSKTQEKFSKLFVGLFVLVFVFVWNKSGAGLLSPIMLVL